MVILSVFLVYSSNIKLNQVFFCSDFVQKSAFVGKYVPNCERLSFGSSCGRPEEKSITSSMGLRTAGDSAVIGYMAFFDAGWIQNARER